MTELTQDQRALIQAALDGKQMQRKQPHYGTWVALSDKDAIFCVVSKDEVRIAPQPRVLHCVQLESGSLIVYGTESVARSTTPDEMCRKYARIEIDADGNITGKVGL